MVSSVTTKSKMARNCEKKLIGLNRMYIKKQQEDEKIKNPSRPPLCSLHSVQEIKNWIPGIKRELDYCLEQLSGARQHQYPERKVKEFEEKVKILEKDYKRFVQKIFELDPQTSGIPWQPRGYTSKRKSSASASDQIPKKKICTPLMDKEKK
ncbi:uncharacterized protein LOC114527128 [Dendronephthya gigantea]|uniref:uncharacterized protein LOC114527128 n=1 Tax=Dendronephthya gigantea TaxID=151771 RepID=UPI00106A7FD0|nr:uncharacterized protein LOC114527128 [Dendronephthya gigantea]